MDTYPAVTSTVTLQFKSSCESGLAPVLIEDNPRYSRPTNGADAMPLGKNRIMTGEQTILTLITTLLGGGVVGALITQFFTREKTRAEAKKTEAEAEKTRAETAKILSEMNVPRETVEANSKLPSGWVKGGSAAGDYIAGVDSQVGRNGKRAAYIKSRKPNPQGFATLMQTFKADAYKGKRIKMSAFAKSERIEGWGGLWMRVDGPVHSVSFDNMQDRPITATTPWIEYEVILDVPVDSRNIAFGFLLVGTGHLWVDDFQFREVGTDIRTTQRGDQDHPVNLRFES